MGRSLCKFHLSPALSEFYNEAFSSGLYNEFAIFNPVAHFFVLEHDFNEFLVNLDIDFAPEDTLKVLSKQVDTEDISNG